MTTQRISHQQGWQQHINQWRKSTLNQAQYCQQHNLKESAFSYHKCKQIKASTTPVNKTTFIKFSPPELLPPQEPLTLHFTSRLSLSGITSNNIDLVKRLTEVLT